MPLISNSPLSPAPEEPRRRRRGPRLGVPALAGLLLFTAGLEVRAQQGALGNPPRIGSSRDDDSLDSKQNSGREEMLRKVEIKRREQIYRENIERAKEGATLGAELRQAFERSKSLGPADQKKLGRLEKLARSIREQAGGDDDKEGLEEAPPGPEASFIQLQELSEELQNKVEKTPRHVVSAAVINSANRLLELIRHIRASFR
jgi:hypothetical protein